MRQFHSEDANAVRNTNIFLRYIIKSEENSVQLKLRYINLPPTVNSNTNCKHKFASNCTASKCAKPILDLGATIYIFSFGKEKEKISVHIKPNLGTGAEKTLKFSLLSSNCCSHGSLLYQP